MEASVVLRPGNRPHFHYPTITALLKPPSLTVSHSLLLLSPSTFADSARQPSSSKHFKTSPSPQSRATQSLHIGTPTLRRKAEIALHHQNQPFHRRYRPSTSSHAYAHNLIPHPIFLCVESQGDISSGCHPTLPHALECHGCCARSSCLHKPTIETRPRQALAIRIAAHTITNLPVTGTLQVPAAEETLPLPMASAASDALPTPTDLDARAVAGESITQT